MEEKVLVVVVEAEVQMNECNLVLLLLLLEPKFGVRQEESKKSKPYERVVSEISGCDS